MTNCSTRIGNRLLKLLREEVGWEGGECEGGDSLAIER